MVNCRPRQDQESENHPLRTASLYTNGTTESHSILSHRLVNLHPPHPMMVEPQSTCTATSSIVFWFVFKEKEMSFLQTNAAPLSLLVGSIPVLQLEAFSKDNWFVVCACFLLRPRSDCEAGALPPNGTALCIHVQGFKFKWPWLRPSVTLEMADQEK